ncbi:MAG TPA: phospholipase D-like domain-containing protein [Gemmatimonadota bacterium]|nr:phospholipase D-like domain-containing protein [Gemmatimonadota bacterium]
MTWSKSSVLYPLAGFGAAALLYGAYALTTAEPTDVLPDRVSLEDPDRFDLATVLAANLDAPLLEGNRIELLENGDEIFPAMLGAIRDARQSINLLTYIYWQGAIAREFAAELAAACRRGVEVRVLLDAVGSIPMDETLVEEMRAAGCRVAVFRPPRWNELRRMNGRTHRKVMVVDGTRGFTGGVGIATEWTGDAEDENHWRDDHFLIEGPSVRYLQGAFAENWREASGEALAGARFYPPIESTGTARVVTVLGQPGGTVSPVAFVYWLSLRRARERVWISTPYYAPDPDLQKSIEETARRGVEVLLIVPNDLNDSRLVRWASRIHYRPLLEAGVRIFEYQPTMFHVKAVIVDRDWAIVGSANFDNRSFELNYEVVVAGEDTVLVADLEGSMRADMRRSKEITLKDVQEWSILERGRDRLASALREQL